MCSLKKVCHIFLTKHISNIPRCGNGRQVLLFASYIHTYAGSSSTEIFQDKFLVQTYTFESQSSVPGENRLSAFWKSLPHGSIKELRYAPLPWPLRARPLYCVCEGGGGLKNRGVL